MLAIDDLRKQLPNVFTKSALSLKALQQGKVRDSYLLTTGERLLVTTDRLSAFDRVIGATPYKGQVLNQLSAWWFDQTCDILPNHLISLPDPNAALVLDVTPYPIEVIVRGFITGVTSTALWHRYALGERTIYGHTFPEGLQKNQRLPEPIITPTTKGSPSGHDERLTCEEVVSQGWVDPSEWKIIQSAALALFKKGQSVSERAGLILVDTKYEFGRTQAGQIVLIDEIHTPDSSRFWQLESYATQVAMRKEPDNFDKEFIRLHLVNAGYKGEGEPPALPDEVWLKASQRYIALYERLTGKTFIPSEYPIPPRLNQNLKSLI